MDAKKYKVSQIVKRYQGDDSLRSFASKLTDGVEGLGLSGQAVHYWQNGVFLPSLNTLMTLITQTSDWRRDFAIEILKEIHPDVFKKILFTNR